MRSNRGRHLGHLGRALLLIHSYNISTISIPLIKFMASTSDIWTSKLGTKYDKQEIERFHDRTMKELEKLRRLDTNSHCADCGQRGTIWSSVNLGVFLCLKCGSLHRALGTHISKPKGCTGTYLWGQDELARMREVGNARANEMYGGSSERPSHNAPDSEWLEFLRQKYDERKFALPHKANEGKESKNDTSSARYVPTVTLIDLDTQVATTKSQPSDFFSEFGL